MNKERVEKEIERFNDLIKKSIDKRDTFINDNMTYLAEFEINEIAYNVEEQKKYICVRHYRKDYDPFYFEIHCEFKDLEEESNINDFTSRYNKYHPYVRYNDYLEKNKNYIKVLETFTYHRMK